MSEILVLVYVAGIFTGLLVFAILLGVLSEPDPARSTSSWDIRVVETDDPSVYRGVYKWGNNVRYSATGRGVTGALENLKQEIEDE